MVILTTTITTSLVVLTCVTVLSLLACMRVMLLFLKLLLFCLLPQQPLTLMSVSVDVVEAPDTTDSVPVAMALTPSALVIPEFLLRVSVVSHVPLLSPDCQALLTS